MPKQYWGLTKGKEPKVVEYASGPNYWYEIRILWSSKLGLQLITKRDLSLEEANAVARRIVRRGYIDINQWHKTFYPKKFFNGKCD